MVSFVAQQARLSMSDCEKICGRWSREIEELAFRSGWRQPPGESFNVPVGTAINMLVLSIVMGNGMELNGTGGWLPGLRNEALLRLGQNISNWHINEVSEANRSFLPTLYGSPDTVRERLGPVLGCCLNVTTRELRVYSQSDVEHLSNSQVEQGSSGRTPRFSIDAHMLARRVRTSHHGPIFTLRAAH